MIFAFAPDWSSPLIERREWRTDVMRSFDGTEERRALRASPRRRWEYRLADHDVSAQRLEAAIWVAQGEPVYLPLWLKAQRTDRAYLTSDTRIYCDPAAMSVAQFQSVTLTDGRGVAEPLFIIGLGADYIDVGYMPRAWSAGALIAPLATARLSRDVSVESLTDADAALPVVFDEEPT